MRTVKALVEYTSDRPTGVAAHFLGGFSATTAEGRLYVGEQFGGVGAGHVQVDDPLDHEGKTHDEADQHRGHPHGITFNEALLEHLVTTFATCICGGCSFWSVRGGRSILGHHRCCKQAHAEEAG